MAKVSSPLTILDMRCPFSFFSTVLTPFSIVLQNQRCHISIKTARQCAQPPHTYVLVSTVFPFTVFVEVEVDFVKPLPPPLIDANDEKLI